MYTSNVLNVRQGINSFVRHSLYLNMWSWESTDIASFGIGCVFVCGVQWAIYMSLLWWEHLNYVLMETYNVFDKD